MKTKGFFGFVIAALLLVMLSASCFAAAELIVEQKTSLDRSEFTKSTELRNPGITFTTSGDIIIGFTTASGGRTGSGLFAEKLDSSLAKIGSAKRLVDEALPKGDVAAITNPRSGDILLVWHEGKTAQRIKGDLLSDSLEVKESYDNFLQSPHLQVEPSLAVSDFGYVGIAWTDWMQRSNGPDSYDVYVKAYDSRMKIIEHSRGTATDDRKQTKPSAAFLSSSNLSVVYQVENTPVSYGSDIIMKVYDVVKNYTFEDVPVEISLGNQYNPKAAAIGNNTIFIVWEDEKDNNYNIYGKIMAQDHQLSDKFGIAVTQYDEKMPVVASLGDYVMVAWIERAEKDIIKAQLYKRNGQEVGSTITADNSSTFKNNLVATAYDSNFLLAFEDYNNLKRDISLVKINLKRDKPLYVLEGSTANQTIAEENLTEKLDNIQQQKEKQSFFGIVWGFLKSLFSR